MNKKTISPRKTTRKPNNATSPQYVQQCIQNGYIHHYDFEFNMGEKDEYKGKYFPIELGISTYTMQSNKEIGSLHIIINSKPPTPFPQGCIQTHGITSETVYANNCNYKEVCEKILSYIDKFSDKQSVWVLKDEIVGGDKKCLDFLFNKANMHNNLKFKKIQHITHHTLMSEWMKMNGILNKYDKNFINGLYKNTTKTVEKKCEYHKHIELEYHCALEDSRNTAITLYFAMNHFLQNSFAMELELENIPIVPTDFTLENKAAVFTTKGYEYDEPYKGKKYGTIREVCCSIVDLQSGTVDKRQSFYLSDEERWKLKDENEKQIISEFMKKKQMTNLQVVHEMSELLSEITKQHKIVVVGNPSDLRKITHFPMKHYLLMREDAFIKKLQDKLAEHHQLEQPKQSLYKTFKKNAEIEEKKECQLHIQHQFESECAVEDNYKTIGYLQYFIQHFKDIYNQFNDIVDEEEIDEVVAYTPSPSVSPAFPISADVSPDISPATSPRISPRKENNEGALPVKPMPIPMQPIQSMPMNQNPQIPMPIPMNQPTIPIPIPMPMNQPQIQIPPMPMNQPTIPMPAGRDENGEPIRIYRPIIRAADLEE